MSFLEKLRDLPVKRDPVFGCIIWVGKKDRDGYGRHKGEVAHRYVYKLLKGEIPKGMELDHICRRRDCVSIKHLVLADRSAQEKAKNWRRRSKRECPNGCDMSVTAMVTPQGGRLCRKCER